jgi:hypothetical protein
MKKKLLLPAAIFVLVSAAVWGFSEANQKQQVSPHIVLIVEQGLHSREGVAKPQTLSIVNPETIEKLEALFPNYRSYPSSSIAGGWEAGRRVYFNFPKGRTVCVTVSRDGKTWSTGEGDFRTQGEFEKLVKQIESQAP